MLNEPHSDLLERAIALPNIARNACQDAVFPIRLASSASRNHVINAQVASGANPAAILTAVGVASIEVPTGEGHEPSGHAVVASEQDHFGHRNG
jgi:hypothetical protein